MGDVKIEAKSLCIGYDSDIVRDISFSVRGGEILTVIGPNGSGKSTLLKTLSAQLKKRGGEIYLLGKKYTSFSARERAKIMSVLLTEKINASLMTGREIVEAGRYPYTGYFGTLSDEDRRAVNEAVSLTASEEFADYSFSALSDGQKQRILLARAICQEPQVLILDEPTSYLDLHHKIAFLDILKHLVTKKDTAVVMSLHELDFAREISDYTICLKDGEVFRQGGAADVFSGETITKLFDISEEMFKRYTNS